LSIKHRQLLRKLDKLRFSPGRINIAYRFFNKVSARAISSSCFADRFCAAFSLLERGIGNRATPLLRSDALPKKGWCFLSAQLLVVIGITKHFLEVDLLFQLIRGDSAEQFGQWNVLVFDTSHMMLNII
jgi:hypothetical protein